MPSAARATLNIQKTSSWFYNCGLGTLVPHLLVHMCPEVQSLTQFLERSPSQTNINDFKNSQGYILLRESFLELYVPNEAQRERIIAENDFESILSNLFSTYTKALEQTIILGLVLRLTLQKVLQKDEIFKNALWPCFTALIHRCLEYIENNNNNNANIATYPYQDTEQILFLANKRKIADIISILQNRENPKYAAYQTIFSSASCPNSFLRRWTHIVNHTCAYIGSMESHSFLSIEHLGALYRSFGFHLLYTTNHAPNTILPVYETKPQSHLRDVIIINQNKNHWDLVCQNLNSVWEGNELVKTDHLKMVHDFFFDQNNKNYQSFLLSFKNGIASFIQNKVNIFRSRCPEKIIKSWPISNSLQALAYKIDEILLLGNQIQEYNILISTDAFISFLTKFKAYYNIEGEFDVTALKTLLKKYPNPHERSMILSKAFEPDLNTDQVGAIYNRFGFNVQFSYYKTPQEMCNLTTRSELTYRMPVPLKPIESLQLNFNGTHWVCLEPKTFDSIIRNACLYSIPKFILEDEEAFKLSIKNAQSMPQVVHPAITKLQFLTALQAQDLLLTEPVAKLPSDFYFAQDNQGNTPLHIAGDATKNIHFTSALTKLISAALLNIREKQTKNWFNSEQVDYWQPNHAGKSALSQALRDKNCIWIKEFHDCLLACEKQASCPSVAQQFRTDIDKLKTQLSTTINDIITSELFSELDKEHLTEYFKLDLMLNEKISYIPGAKNAFHLAFRHNRYDEVAHAFEMAIERSALGLDANIIEDRKIKFRLSMPQIINEYDRDLNFYLNRKITDNLPKSRVAHFATSIYQGFENAYDQAKWQWNFLSTLQNTKTYTTCIILKSVAEIPNNMATGGIVYASIVLAANVFGISQVQQNITWGASAITGLAGKGIGAALDQGSSYIWGNPIEDASSYSQTFEYYGGKTGAIILTGVFTIAPWIACPYLKAGSVALGIAGANITRYFLPEYTNTQAFFYFLMSDIPFYYNFKAASVEDPHYDSKIQFNCEQFFSKSMATTFTTVLKNIDYFSDAYKNMLQTISSNTVNAFYSVPLFETGIHGVNSGFSWFTNTPPVKPIIDIASYTQKQYYKTIEIAKERLEKDILNLLPKTEHSDKRLYELELNRITRMMQDETSNQADIQSALKALEIQFKSTIGFKALEKWMNQYEHLQELEIHLDRLKQADTLDDAAICQTQEDLKTAHEYSETLWSDIELHNNHSVIANAKIMKQEVDKKVKALRQREIKGIQSLKSWSVQHKALQEAEINLFNLEQNKQSSPSDIETMRAEVADKRSKLEALWSDVTSYNDAPVVENATIIAQKIENNVTQMKANFILAGQYLDAWKNQYIFVKELEIKINLAQKAFKVDTELLTQYNKDLASGYIELDRLRAIAISMSDNTVIDSIQITEIQTNKQVSDTISKLIDYKVLEPTLKNKIEGILGDFKKPRAFYADEITKWILDIKDPFNAWTPEKKQAEYKNIYQHIYNKSLFNFETRGPKRRGYCRKKLYRYSYEKITGHKPPVPNGLSTWCKSFINEGFYTFFKCEPFQDIAQHTDVSFNYSRVFITLGAIAVTFGAAAYAGIPISLGIGAGNGVLGVGAAIGLKGSDPNALASFGEDARGWQKDFNKSFEPYTFDHKTINLANVNNDVFLRPARTLETSIEPLLANKSHSFFGLERLSLNHLTIPQSTPTLLDFNWHNTYATLVPLTSLEEQVAGYITMSNSQQVAKKNNIRPARIKTSTPLLLPTPAVRPAIKSKAAPVISGSAVSKLNPAAKLTAFYGGYMPESFQLGTMISAFAHATKNTAFDLTSFVYQGLQLSKDVYIVSCVSFPDHIRDPAQERVGNMFSVATVALTSAIRDPKSAFQKYFNSKNKNESQALEIYTKKINQGKGWDAGAALAPVVQDAIEVVAILGGIAGIAKTGVALGKVAVQSTIKAGAKLAPKISILSASEQAFKPVAKAAKRLKTAKLPAVVIPEHSYARHILPLYDAKKIKTLTPSLSMTIPTASPVKLTTDLITYEAGLDIGNIIEHAKPSAVVALDSLKSSTLGPAPVLSAPHTGSSIQTVIHTQTAKAPTPILFSQRAGLSDLTTELPNTSITPKMNPSSAPNMATAVANMSQEAAQQAHQLKFLPALQAVLQKYEFRSPVLFDAGAAQGRLNSGVPLDLIKLQTPIIPVIPTAIGPATPALFAAQEAQVSAGAIQRVSDATQHNLIEPCHNANNVNAQVALNKKMSALERAQKKAVKIQEVPDGRIRYYRAEQLSIKSGLTRGASYVTEHNLNTGQVRSWMECYDHFGKINRIHPKMIDGQDIIGQHYPPTKVELEAWNKKMEPVK